MRLKLKRFSFFRQTVLLPAIILLSVFSVAIAEDVSFDAVVDASRVAMGSALQLTLTVHGSQDVSQLSLPAIDGFEARFVGPSTQVQVINGEYSTSKAFTYMLIPLKEGKFSIPSLEVNIKGKTYATQPQTVEVLPAGASPGEGAGGQAAENDPHAYADRVQMVIVIPDSVKYVNEEIPLAIKLYVRELPIQIASLTQMDHDGFTISEFSAPKQYQDTVNGKTYDVVEYNARLKPLREGSLKVGPAVLAGNLMVKDNVRRNPFGGNAFNDDFFAGFFNSLQKKPVSITSQPVMVTVKALPPEGKPADFSGGVGVFTFDVTAAPVKIKAGDPVTVKMSVSGSGDLKSIRMPVVKDGRFKMYDPQVKEAEGQKILEQVIVPLKEGQIELAPLTFSYFDTHSGQYVSLKQGPFPIQVLPMDQGQEFQAVGFADKQGSLIKENLGNDIVFIKEHPGRLSKKKSWLERNGWLLAAGVVYLNVWGMLYGIYLYRRKLSDDPGFARRSAAMRSARETIKKLEPLMVADGSKVFYTGLVKVLTDYLEKKMGVPPGKTDPVTLESVLSGRRVESKYIVSLKEIFELAERARFASGSVSVADMKRSYLDMEELLDAIERRVR